CEQQLHRQRCSAFALAFTAIHAITGKVWLGIDGPGEIDADGSAVRGNFRSDHILRSGWRKNVAWSDDGGSRIVRFNEISASADQAADLVRVSFAKFKKSVLIGIAVGWPEQDGRR